MPPRQWVSGSPDAAPRRALVATGVGFALSLVCAVLSDGVYHEDDLVHLQMAEWAFRDPRYLLDSWGRPGFTALYAIPAQAGWLSARIFTAVLAAATAWLSFRIAQGFGLRLAWIVPALLWAQPLYFTLTYTTLTETTAAFYLTLAMYAWQRGSLTCSAALVSLLVLTRHEAVVVAGLWGLMLLQRRAPWSAWLALAWAPVAHNVLSFVFLGRVPIEAFLEPKPADFYGSGHWFTMSLHAHWAYSSAVVFLAGAGAAALAVRRNAGAWWLAAGGVWILTHTVVFKFGLFGSGGYARFLLVVSPVIATAAAFGIDRALRLHHIARHRRPPRGTIAGLTLGLGGVAAVTAMSLAAAASSRVLDWRWLVGLAVLLAALWFAAASSGRKRWAFSWVPQVSLALWVAHVVILWTVAAGWGQAGPLRLQHDQHCVKAAAEWITARQPDAPDIASASPWVEVFAGGWRPWGGRPLASRVAQLDAGSFYLWESRHAPYREAALQPDSLLADPTMIEVFSVPSSRGTEPCARVFQRR